MFKIYLQNIVINFKTMLHNVYSDQCTMYNEECITLCNNVYNTFSIHIHVLDKIIQFL